MKKVKKCLKCVHYSVCGKAEYEADIKDCIDFLAEKQCIDFSKYIGKKVYVRKDTWGRVFDTEIEFYEGHLWIVGEIISVIRTKKQTLVKICTVPNYEGKNKYYKRYPIGAIGITVFIKGDRK